MKKYFLISLAIVAFCFFFENPASAASLPTVATGGTHWVFTTSADLGFSLSNLGGASSVTMAVEYGTTTAYGSVAAGGTMTSIGSNYTRTGLSTLLCNTTYHYRARGTNSAGTAYGADATFTTNPCVSGTAASVTTVSSTVLSPSSVTLNGNITATGGVGLSVLWRGFQYWPTGGLTLDNLTAGTFGTGSYSSTLTGLMCGTTYNYKALTANTVYFGSGATLTFTTLPCLPGIPTVTTLPAVITGPYTATINGRVDATGGATVTSTGFTGSFGSPFTTPVSITTVPTLFSKNLTGLGCGTTYTFTAQATNSVGTGSGSTLNFSTLACPVVLPSVTTDPATAITAVFANLNGTVSSTGGSIPVTEGFDYGTTIAYGSSYVVASATTVGSFSGGPSIPLICNTLYHYRAFATNSAGTAYGIDRTFTTLPCPGVLPTVITDPATIVTVSSGMIWGNITVVGSAPVTARGFQFGLTTTYGSTGTSTGTFGVGTFNANQTGLACNTLYHYRAFATNSAGTAYGIDRTFTTLPCPITIVSPTVITTTAIPVGTTTATLQGSITATGGASATVVGFNWSTTTTVAGTGGAFVSTTAGGPFGVGAFSIPISGLACNTLYHYRAWATNSSGTSYGADMTLTTSPCPVVPIVTTLSASAISMTSGVLYGNLGGLGGAINATTSFEYGTTIAYGSTITATSPAQPMTVIGGFNVNLTGLVCGTTYHYRAKGTNSVGSAYGADMTFTTLPCPVTVVPPTVVTVAATSITTTSAVLNGNLTSTGGVGIPTTVDLLWDLTTATGYSNSASAGTMTTPGTFNATITGLVCNTAYHFFAQATNSAGTVYDVDLPFTTLPCPITIVPPTVATNPVSAIGVTTATLNGNLTGLGGATNATASFEYGLTTSYGTTTTATTPTQPMSATGVFSRNLTALVCNTTYHFRAKATNSAGSAFGIDRTFITGTCPVTITPPGVTTDPVSALTTVSATLNGTLTSLGGVSSATTLFEYGPTTAYGSTTTFGSMSATGTFSKNITGLVCGTSYNFRAKATNSMGSVYGINRVFTTTSCPIAPPGVSTMPEGTVTTTTAIINGQITGLGGTGVSVTPSFNVSGGSFGTVTPSSITVVGTNFSATLGSLACGTTYTYTAKASNSGGTTIASTSETFTTNSCPAPAVTTISGTISGPSLATLNGNLGLLGAGATSAIVGFDYGPTSSYGYSTTLSSPMFTTGPFSTSITIPVADVTCNNFWHLRAKATNSFGVTAYGVDKTFCF